MFTILCTARGFPSTDKPSFGVDGDIGGDTNAGGGGNDACFSCGETGYVFIFALLCSHSYVI